MLRYLGVLLGLFTTACAPSVQPHPIFPFVFSINGVSTSAAKFGSATIQAGTEVWEYDYSGLHLDNEHLDGAGLARGTFPAINHFQGIGDPIDHDTAYSRMATYFLARGGAGSTAIGGHYYLQHMTAALGARGLGCEVGENINSTQSHIAFTRGAAKQYRLKWGVDMSSWFGPSITAYDGTWGAYGGPDNGHSLSLHKRTYYTAYASGANWVQAEAGAINLFNGDSLTALGVVAKEFYDFTQANPDLGEPYVPYAVLVPRNHGFGLSTTAWGLSWATLSPSVKEQGLTTLFSSIWPQSFTTSVMGGDESLYMVNAPDLFDVITEDAATTGYYQVLDATHHTYNLNDVLPFGISGDIQYLLNKKDAKHWTITLINNKGITKQPLTAEVVDPSQAKTVTLSGQFTAVTALRGSSVSLSNFIQITVDPGDVAIYSVTIQ
jgi:hypothetical protein